MAKSKKNLNKAKLNLTVREEQRNKLEQMASLENRSNKFQIFRNFLPQFPYRKGRDQFVRPWPTSTFAKHPNVRLPPA
jgi:hypothetical protein